MRSHASRHTAAGHLQNFYSTFDDIRGQKFDGMVITGAPVERMDFEEVDYWPELTELMDWSKSHVYSTLHICWAAQAGLYHHFGINKVLLENKLSGVFEHTVTRRSNMLFRGCDDYFYLPHSRHTDIDEQAVRDNPRSRSSPPRKKRASLPSRPKRAVRSSLRVTPNTTATRSTASTAATSRPGSPFPSPTTTTWTTTQKRPCA